MNTAYANSLTTRILTGILLAGLCLPAFARTSSSTRGGGAFSSSATGDVIFDATSTPGSVAVGANLIFYSGGTKTQTAIGTGYGGNAISIDRFQTLVRDTSVTPNDLLLYIGQDTAVVNDQQYGTQNAYNYFASGNHLFELNRLRTTADWLSQDNNHDGVPDNITPDTGVSFGTYGTVSMQQFIDNIAAGKTMYGPVRVRVPLQLNSPATGTSVTNALGNTVDGGTIYGFCRDTTTGLCTCAPGTSKFSKITEGTTVCGKTMPSNAKIKVRGSLLWDFVDNLTGAPVELANLPFAPRDLYFKVEIPIMVDWANDANDDGTMDNMPYIQSLTHGMSGTNPINVTNNIGPLDFNRVPQESKDAYRYVTGTTLTSAVFAGLNRPTQYHLLMPSGYETGWAAAFDKLNITASTWASLPPSNCLTHMGTACAKFGVPSWVTGIMTADDIRSGDFEDIPTYLYTGGLIDMHDHVNISGLVYVPQAMELEALSTTAPTQQYIYGATVVRDTFFIGARDNTIQVFSAGPETYSTALTTLSSSSSQTGPSMSSFSYGTTSTASTTTSSGGGSTTTTSSTSSGSVCVGCSSANSSSGGGGNNGIAGNARWVEIRPNR